MSRHRDRGWPEPPEPLPVPTVDNHTHLESVLEVRADGWHGERGPSPDGADQREPDGGRPQRGPDASGSQPTTVPDLAAHLDRAAAVGVTRMVQVGCDLEAVAWTDAVVRTDGRLLGAVAIHPNEAVLHAGVHEVAPDGLDPDPQPRHRVTLDEALGTVARVARDNPRVRAIGASKLWLWPTRR